MRGREEGFTLIELAVSVGLFGVIIIGMTVLFRSSFTTANEARFEQMAKTIAQERLEGIRALPFHISYKENTLDVDILDLYYPDDGNVNPTPTQAVGTYQGSPNYTFTSTRTVTEPNAPAFTETVVMQFVLPLAGGTLAVRPPVSGYDSNSPDVDTPGADAVKATVVVAWTARGRTESVTLNTVIARGEPAVTKAEASGSVLGAQVTGVSYQDGDTGGLVAELQAQVGRADSSFREVTQSVSQATADPVEILEVDPATNVPVQPPAPSAGLSTASVPNSATGNTQTNIAFTAPGSMSGVNAPFASIASWCTDEDLDCEGRTTAQVHGSHSLDPEGRAIVAANDVIVNARDFAEALPHRVFEVGSVTGTIEQGSTDGDVEVEATVSLDNVAIWASTSFVANPRYEGTVLIDALDVAVRSTANNNAPSGAVSWSVFGLRIWDPNLLGVGATLGGYGPSYSFGFDSSCGQWVGSPASCAPPFENPNPVQIPAAYVGVDTGGNPATSISIVAGATIRDSSTDGTTTSNATTAQKNVLTINTRDDIVGAAALEPSVSILGGASTSTTFLVHEH